MIDWPLLIFWIGIVLFCLLVWAGVIAGINALVLFLIGAFS